MSKTQEKLEAVDQRQSVEINYKMGADGSFAIAGVRTTPTLDPNNPIVEELNVHECFALLLRGITTFHLSCHAQIQKDQPRIMMSRMVGPN